jgi:putative DNA primase/helicase
MAAGADMKQVLAVRGVIEKDADQATRMFALTEHLALLEQLILDVGAIFVVMDPITTYLGPDINSHKEADVRAVLGPLSLLAERTRIVLVMLMHLNKGTGVSALYRATGSIAFPAVARVVLGVAPDPNDEQRRLLLPVKMNIGKISTGIGYRIETARTSILSRVSDEDQPPVLLWDSEPVTIDASSALDRNGTAQELGASAEVKSVLTELLADGRVPATRCKTVIRESTGVTSETTLSRARRELGVKVRREGFGEGGTWYWELPSIDTHTRARINGPHSLEPMDSKQSMDSSIPSIDANGSNDYKESKALTRARECKNCGGPLPHPHTTLCEKCSSEWRNPINKGDLPF